MVFCLPYNGWSRQQKAEGALSRRRRISYEWPFQFPLTLVYDDAMVNLLVALVYIVFEL